MVFVENKLIFIKRSDTMPSHKGQVGFMGGHKIDGEKDPIDTAMRELKEESGFDADLFKVHGMIEPVFTSNRKLVVPVVSEFRKDTSHFLDNVCANDEWDHLMLCSFDHLANESNWQVAKVVQNGHRYVAFSYLNNPTNKIHPHAGEIEFLLWGASAKMVWNFFKCHK